MTIKVKIKSYTVLAYPYFTSILIKAMPTNIDYSCYIKAAEMVYQSYGVHIIPIVNKPAGCL